MKSRSGSELMLVHIFEDLYETIEFLDFPNLHS